MQQNSLGGDGPLVSTLALGGASLGGVYQDVSQAEADEVVAAALQAGVNLIDVAPYYGLTRAETALGVALRGAPRNDYVLMTKVGRYGDKDWDFSRDGTLRSLDASLARLGVDHIDVLQCHDIEHGDRRQLLDEALPTLRTLKSEGVIGRIGVTGYDLSLLEDVAVEQQVDTVMAYCTYTLQDRRLAETARRLNAAEISVFNASPLGMGLLTAKGPPDWHPAHLAVRQAAAEAAKACAALGADLSVVALQFAFQTAARIGVASTVVGMSKASNLTRNIEAMTAPLDPAILAAVEAALASVRDIGWDVLPGDGGKAGR
ncbi:MAG: aldo/keto reductase [Brevundimonas sp.]|jgi:L-galactose dehydrogenase|uniref:aldo/keto reductase n=1 Tax=Brevundimonas sp. TaxID=1871086 RepID=UPI0025B93480|nr:aldo/keto reductase [Brevundimonas sp.]MCH4267891.1 aldo/keto reductase [Brevundimonas sp.]